MCILMGKRLAVFLEFSFSSIFLGVKNAKIDFFKIKNGFERSFFFYEIDV